MIEPAENDFKRLAALLNLRPTKRRGLTMPEFAETTIVTAGRMKGRKFDLSYSPYARRPLELLSPESSTQLVVLMFPAQSTKSVIGQICAAYYSKELPSEVIYATADLATARKTMERRLEPLYSSLGIQFRTQSENRKSRRTGDITFSKEFDGGNIDIVTANSAAALSAETKRVAIGDEIDRWSRTLSDEGSPWAQLWARLKAWLDEKKGLAISTATDIDTSLIFSLFLTGTQEEWYVPCPYCGEMQTLKVRDSLGHGLTWGTKKGTIDESSVEYICKKCAKGFKEVHKYDIQQGGEWRQEGEPIDEYTASFHLHALNSMFESWYNIAKGWELGQSDPLKRKEFVNLTEGLPFREIGMRPKAENVIKQRGTYKSGVVPMGALILTVGVDVQRGAERYRNMEPSQLAKEIAKAGTEAQEKNFPRIEFEVLATGPGHRTWSICYNRFLGKIENAFAGAWQLLDDWAQDIIQQNGGFGFIREVDGFFFPISLVFIDSGDGEITDTVYQFSQRWGACFPCKGFTSLKQRKNQKGDELTPDNFMRFKASKVGSDITLYSISTNYYKTQIYRALEVKRTDDKIQPANFCDFPRDYVNDYFIMLTAEERRSDGSYHSGGRRNESLDCRTYATCAADVYLGILVDRYREAAKKLGKSEFSVKTEVNRRVVIDDLCRRCKLPKEYYL